MKKIVSIGFVFLLLFVLLSACNLPRSGSQPTTDPNVVFTAAALTVQAKLEENTPIPALPTTAPQEQPTQQLPTEQPPAAATATSLPSPTKTSVPCDVAKFVSDVSIPDDTVFAPEASFTKTWRIKNEGTCTWNTSYAVVFDSGASMGGPASFAIPSDVAPGQSIDISVDLKAPASADTYKGNWMLRNASGVIFGLGDENKPFWVQIKVQEPTSVPFAVTSASFDMIPNTFTGVCPANIVLRGKIKTNGAGSVTYTYRREDGFISPPMTKNFDSAGELNLVDYVMPVGGAAGFAWAGNVWIWIDEPNHQSFDKQLFTINCLAP
ncbi:MAG: hypothetical protein CL609_11370 [Anaerolineaceae bacterium]|nr:hypothetical protein [Anaerolineaceae bacterium]